MRPHFAYKAGRYMTQTLFVTGGSRGIGEAVVRLAAGHYNVAFSYNSSKQRAEDLARELDGQYGGVIAVHCDVRDPASVAEAVAAVNKRFGRIDVLVNNAGVALSKLFTDTTLQDWRQLFAVNVEGVYNVTSATLGAMLSRRSGCIINVASIWGEVGASMEVAYSASKAAVIGFTKALAREVAQGGVRVAAVSPGATATDMMSAYTPAEVDALISEHLPLGRLCDPSEVAQLILHIAQNGYLSGCNISINGAFE